MAIGSNRIENLSQINRMGNFCVVGNGILLTATSVSSSVQFPSLSDGNPATDVLIVNTGSVPVFITFGTSAPTAVAPTAGVPANGICIPPGAMPVFDKSFNTFVAGITASGSATVYLYQGIGS